MREDSGAKKNLNLHLNASYGISMP